ncbi:hypothetical protein K7432_007655 [Basidiobolus ranarum]|uniref:Anaphase-promoting complex subunit 10 n=1 Tax=Basidiobolus ranarum TaxID=34480 RepID=A0ABR2WT05_9FUNG
MDIFKIQRRAHDYKVVAVATQSVECTITGNNTGQNTLSTMLEGHEEILWQSSDTPNVNTLRLHSEYFYNKWCMFYWYKKDNSLEFTFIWDQVRYVWKKEGTSGLRCRDCTGKIYATIEAFLGKFVTFSSLEVVNSLQSEFTTLLILTAVLSIELIQKQWIPKIHIPKLWIKYALSRSKSIHSYLQNNEMIQKLG